MSKRYDNNNKIAIDLMWLRPGKVGGTESFIRNLLDGFVKLNEEYSFVLLVSQDNKETFRHYTEDKRFELLEAPIPSANIAKRILWQNVFQNRFLRKNGLTKCFVPVYCKPWFNGGIEYTCVIHDLQALHYPEYHPFHEVAYSKICWYMDVKKAKRIVAISNFVREDIEKYYQKKDVTVIYNPILIKPEEKADFKELSKKYGIEEDEYYYTVAQIIPHKNISTIVKMMDELVHNDKYTHFNLPRKLLITGINGKSANVLMEQIKELRLVDNIIFSGYISNSERNTLYSRARAFLFPSVFEGFGMPPLEAMYLGCPVVTTRCASIPEVTQNKAVYVDNPYDADEWIKKTVNAKRGFDMPDFSIFDAEILSRRYLNILLG